MAKKKEYGYVLVMTEKGPVFVTKVNNADRTAEWNKLEKPYSMSKENAQFLAKALTLNGNSAYPVIIDYEQSYQPYRYDVGDFEWVKNS